MTARPTLERDKSQRARAKDAEEATPGFRYLTFVGYFLAFLVLLVASAVAFRAYELQRAKYVAFLIVAAGVLVILPKVILLLPAVQSIEIGKVKVTMQKIEAEVNETKQKLQDSNNFVGELFTEIKGQQGLVQAQRPQASREKSPTDPNAQTD